VDKYGRNGNLINKGQYYVFQPLEITDEYASLIERSIPVQFKPNKLELQLPDQNLVESSSEPEMTESIINDYNTIIQTLTENIVKTKSDIVIKSGDNDWYKHLSKVYDILIANKFSKIQVDKYIIHHFLDSLSIQDKVTIINNIFQNDVELSKDEVIIKTYFQNYTINDGEGIVLIDVIKPKQPFRIYTLNTKATPIWNQVESSNVGKYKSELKEFIVANVSNINTSIFGFIDRDTKRNIIFKTRNIDEKQRNISGFNCNTAGKNDIIKKINDLPITLKVDYDTVKKQGLCVIFELIFRKFDEDKLNGKRWLFDTVLRNKNLDTFIGKIKP